MRATDQPRPTRLRGNTAALLGWRAVAVVSSGLQRLTPRRWWDRYLCPGHLVVTTNSSVALEAIDSALEILATRRYFRARDVTRIGPQAHRKDRPELASPPPVLAAWTLEVSRGSEPALLREIEYRVARALEIHGNYAGIDPALSLRLARSVIAAHQSRRAHVTSVTTPLDLPVVNVRALRRCTELMGIAEPSTRAERVEVAVLDTLPIAELSPHIEVASHEASELRPRPHPHGTAAAAVVAALAPTARVVVYPVARTNNDEAALISALLKVAASDAAVVLMSFALEFTHRAQPRTRQSSVAMLLPGLGPAKVVVASAGNAQGRKTSRAARFPAIAPGVMMVGAVELSDGESADATLADYSCYQFDPPGPALYVVAPGGPPVASVEDVPFAGTSAAAAYAAGLVAGLVAEHGLPPGITPALDVLAQLRSAAVRTGSFADSSRYGAGLLHWPRPVPVEPTDFPDGVARLRVSMPLVDAWAAACRIAHPRHLAGELDLLVDTMEDVTIPGRSEHTDALMAMYRAARLAAKAPGPAVMRHLRAAGPWAVEVAEGERSRARTATVFLREAQKPLGRG